MNIPRLIILTAILLRMAVGAGFDFAILGDRTGKATPGVYESICRQVASRHPALVVSIGDTIEGLDDTAAAAQWADIRSAWKPFGDTPFYLVPGNHDIWSAASERLWRLQTGHPPQYSFDYQGAHFTVLDNSRTEGLGPEQLQFLESDLAAHASASPKFVFFHRPFWLIPVKFGNGNFPLHRLAKQYGVSYVVSGHAHQFDRSEYQGVQYIMVGSSGGSLTHGKAMIQGNVPDGLYFGYAWVHVEVGAGNGAATLEFQHSEGLR